MYVLLDRAEQGRPGSYPPWCNLSWFYNCTGIERAVEPHYHDTDEIWLWHQGSAEAVVEGETVPMRPGTMLYTPAQCLHSYGRQTLHNNTGIHCRVGPSTRRGHLHLDETGEELKPRMRPFWYEPEQNNPATPARFPREAFLQNAYCGRHAAGEELWRGERQGWWAALVREGGLRGRIGDDSLNVPAGKLLIVKARVSAALYAEEESEVAFALGWPICPSPGTDSSTPTTPARGC